MSKNVTITKVSVSTTINDVEKEPDLNILGALKLVAFTIEWGSAKHRQRAERLFDKVFTRVSRDSKIELAFNSDVEVDRDGVFCEVLDSYSAHVADITFSKKAKGIAWLKFLEGKGLLPTVHENTFLLDVKRILGSRASSRGLFQDSLGSMAVLTLYFEEYLIAYFKEEDKKSLDLAEALKRTSLSADEFECYNAYFSSRGFCNREDTISRRFYEMCTAAGSIDYGHQHEFLEVLEMFSRYTIHELLAVTPDAVEAVRDNREYTNKKVILDAIKYIKKSNIKMLMLLDSRGTFSEKTFNSVFSNKFENHLDAFLLLLVHVSNTGRDDMEEWYVELYTNCLKRDYDNYEGNLDEYYRSEKKDGFSVVELLKSRGASEIFIKVLKRLGIDNLLIRKDDKRVVTKRMRTLFGWAPSHFIIETFEQLLKEGKEEKWYKRHNFIGWFTHYMGGEADLDKLLAYFCDKHELIKKGDALRAVICSSLYCAKGLFPMIKYVLTRYGHCPGAIPTEKTACFRRE